MSDEWTQPKAQEQLRRQWLIAHPRITLTVEGAAPSDFRLRDSSSTSLSLLLRRGEDEEAASFSGDGSQGLVFSISAAAATTEVNTSLEEPVSAAAAKAEVINLQTFEVDIDTFLFFSLYKTVKEHANNITG